MFQAIRTRVNATSVVAVLALVFAMTGGAYAAKKYLITSTKQISPSVLKSLQGKAGAPGSAGHQGSAWPQRPAGPQGPAGGAGAKGETGPAGQAGPVGATGATGKAGKAGKEGSPWTLGGTLPGGAIETGTWALGTLPPNTSEPIYIPISFTIRLVASLDANHVHYVKPGETAPAGCTGGTASAPTAEPGNFCIYASLQGFGLSFIHSIQPGAFETEELGAGTAGAVLVMIGGEGAQAGGTWAVTGEEE
jgi:hypothetical protein